MQCRAESFGPSLREFSLAVESSVKSLPLGLLRAVEETVTVLVSTQDALKDLLVTAHDRLECVIQNDKSVVLDPELKYVAMLESLEAMLADLHEECEFKLNAALADEELQGAHEAAVVTEYKNMIELLSDIHEVTTQLRWSVLEHDADVEEASEQNVVSLDEFLKELRA